MTDTNQSDAGEAIPGLLDDIVFTHVLRSEYFDDPADLARLPAVSRAMRDAMVATGLRFEELGEDEAVKLGRLSVLKRLQRQGRLSRRERLCEAAAKSGQLEELILLVENGWSWDEHTCSRAAWGGYLEVLQYLPFHTDFFHTHGYRLQVTSAPVNFLGACTFFVSDCSFSEKKC